MSSSYQQTYRQSIEQPEQFWAEQSKRIDWHRAPTELLNDRNPPFIRWFEDGQTNLCYNAIDRHLDNRADQAALVWESTEVDQTRSWTYSELYDEVNTVAAMIKSLGVEKGDRVLIYMPMIAEATFVMLACARLGATHSVVFGGFASASLAKRIDDAQPKLVITADAGMRGGKIIPYKPLLDTALELANHKPGHVLLVNRGLDKELNWLEPRDIDYASLAERYENVEITPTWVDSNHPSYVLYTSGTTGMPKGVQRDTGGYAVSLAASMEYIYGCQPGETILTTSDIGWVVGHSYIVYGPLIHGMTTIVYEGLPVQPDPAIWWKLVEKYKVTTMFSSPTAIRVLKKQDPKYFTAHDTSSLRTLFLAGEPLDETTHGWTTDILKTRVVDHYWQTESGWPILANCAGLDPQPAIKPGSPTWPVYGYQMEMVDEQLQTQDDNVKGKLVIKLPTPPGFMSTVWGDDERFVKQYFLQRGDDWLYTTGDYAVRDDDGYYFILGRDDDVINVAGHRLGSREIEETLSSAEGLVESAVIGVKDQLKGQAVTAFVVLQQGTPDSDADHQQELKRLQRHVDQQLGAIARPSTIYFVTALPKTRSGKIMRRTMLALVEGQPVGDISTIEDRQALDDIEQLLTRLKQD